jgi:O-antigen ligase
MTRLLIDTVGWAGAAALLLAYGLVSSGRLNGRSIRFQLLNLCGAVGLLANGIYHDAWPSAALNAVWFVIGVTALVRISRTPTSQSGRSSRRP